MNEPLTYDELLHRIWVVGHHTAELLVKYEDSTFLKYADISHQQYVILMIMAMQKEPTTATFIAHHMARNVNTLSTMLDRMESKGLGKKVRDLIDRRSVSLIMTDKGKEALQSALMAGWSMIEKVFSDYSQEEVQQLLQLTDKIRTRVLAELSPEDRKLALNQTPEDFEVANIRKLMQSLSNTKE